VAKTAGGELVWLASFAEAAAHLMNGIFAFSLPFAEQGSLPQPLSELKPGSGAGASRLLAWTQNYKKRKQAHLDVNRIKQIAY
jgi:hypothetical protein